MRDPKTHAKVLALRWEALWRTIQGEAGPDRLERLLVLSSRINGLIEDHQERTGWVYAVMPSPPRWQYAETIIDTEEEA